MKVPSWLYEIKSDSTLNSRDVAGILGITVRAMEMRVIRGKFPLPDHHIIRWRKRSVPSKQWYVKTIIKFIKSQHVKVSA